MKTLALFICLLATTAFAFTYDGPINPEDFINWTPVIATPCLNGGIPHLHITLANPDPEAKIKEAEIVVLNETIVAYTYEIGDVTYVFALEDGHYRQVEPLNTQPQKIGD